MRRAPVEKDQSIGPSAILLVVNRDRSGSLHDPAVGSSGCRVTKGDRQTDPETTIVSRPVLRAIGAAACRCEIRREADRGSLLTVGS